MLLLPPSFSCGFSACFVLSKKPKANGTIMGGMDTPSGSVKCLTVGGVAGYVEEEEAVETEE